MVQYVLLRISHLLLFWYRTAADGAVRIITCIKDAKVIGKIVTHLNNKRHFTGYGLLAGRADAACWSLWLTSSLLLVALGSHSWIDGGN